MTLNTWTQLRGLTDRNDLADFLGVSYKRLIWHLYRSNSTQRYRNFSIPKKTTGMRTISEPNPFLKSAQRSLSNKLSEVYRAPPYVFGFVLGKRNPLVENARMHLRKEWVLNLDLEDFFGSITFQRVYGLFYGAPFNLNASIASTLAHMCTHEGRLAQGAPTSPIISNMISLRMDGAFARLAAANSCFYSRYADDLTFSSSVKVFPSAIAATSDGSLGGTPTISSDIELILNNNGFTLNRNKLRLQHKNNRQLVTGLVVNRKINVRRKYVRNLRSVMHKWEVMGYDAAEDVFQNDFLKHRRTDRDPPSMWRHIRGKLEFLKNVRGEHDVLFQTYWKKFRHLDEALVSGRE